jgi:MFS family permease
MDQAYFVIIAVFLSIFGTAYTYLSYRNKERLALIDSGLSPDTFKQMLHGKGKSLLVFGLVFIGFSLGIIIGFFFEKYLLMNHNPNGYRNYPQAYLTMVPFCIGIALVISFYLNRRNDK